MSNENVNRNKSKENSKRLEKNQVFNTYEDFNSYIEPFFRENYWIMNRSHSDKDKTDGKIVRLEYVAIVLVK